jgi:hypothetical protein
MTDEDFKKLMDAAGEGLRKQEDKLIREMMDKTEKHQVGIIFEMPYGSDIRIYSNKAVTIDTEMNEEIDGVFYTMQWGEEKLPWSSKTQLQITAMAMAARWAAKEMLRRTREE